MRNPDDQLRHAAALVRERANNAMEHGEERWMVDQTGDDYLVVGSFMPDDVAEDGVISTAVVATMSYPDDPERRAPALAVGMAQHIAGLDPFTALALADFFELAADRWGQDNTLAIGRAALRAAQAYLRFGDTRPYASDGDS